jgi:hypothetical protein
MQPQQIQEVVYPSLTLEEVYATILYYLRNKESVEAYLARGEEVGNAYYQEHLQQEPSPVVKRLRELRNNPDEIQRLLALRQQQIQDEKKQTQDEKTRS